MSHAPIYKISLAEWSLSRPIFAGEMQHLDFPTLAKSAGIDAIEYVNQFFMDKARDRAYLTDMKRRADDAGVSQLLIMCDNEGRLGDPDEAIRQTAVENHHKWVEAAAFLGCHTIRVNGYSTGTADEQSKLVADGLGRLCEFADPHGINVVVENHGGHSSNAKWLMETIRRVNHPRAGTLPDFGNFKLSPTRAVPDGPLETYDSYLGVAEMMPLAKGVSVKMKVYDAHGGQHDIDLKRMMKIVVDSGYHGHAGIEHVPGSGELAAVSRVREQLETVRTELTG
jgi:sugar phosphate isomerase/epimerase